MKSKRKWVYSICAWVVFVYAVSSWATIITIELGSPLDTNPDPYIVDVQQLEIISHSEIQLDVENIENPLRWKEWELTVYVPEANDPLTHLDVLQYKWGETSVIEIYDVPMEPDPGALPIPGYNPYHADTAEDLWYEYGTQPIGADWGRVDIGNPGYVGFTFYVDVPQSTPVFVSLHDICIPEPTTIAMLSFGILALLRKRR